MCVYEPPSGVRVFFGEIVLRSASPLAEARYRDSDRAHVDEASQQPTGHPLPTARSAAAPPNRQYSLASPLSDGATPAVADFMTAWRIWRPSTSPLSFSIAVERVMKPR